MIKEETALFIGHSECYNVSSQAIENVIVDLINQGITVFLSGGQGGFDRLCVAACGTVGGKGDLKCSLLSARAERADISRNDGAVVPLWFD